MPDPTKQTVSASQVAILFNRSPYATPWMLYQDFIGAQPLPDVENDRMDIGKRIEGVILDLAAERLRLDVVRNEKQVYLRVAEGLGCTTDAMTNCPTRGPGVVEAKNVDRLQWLTGWTDTTAPVHIELQLQCQMAVMGYDWGVIAAFVGGNELKIYERQYDQSLTSYMELLAGDFLTKVNDRTPPPMDGVTMEIPQLAELRVDDPAPDLVDRTDDQDAFDIVTEYDYWKSQAAFAKKNETRLRPKVLAIEPSADVIRVHGHLIQIKRKRGTKTLPQLPKCIVDTIVSYLANPDRDPRAVEALSDAMLWNAQGKEEGSVRTTIKISKHDDGTTPWSNKWGLSE